MNPETTERVPIARVIRRGREKKNDAKVWRVIDRVD